MSWKITDEHIDAMKREAERTQPQVNMDGIHTGVSDVTYEHWMNDVLALPKKQQKKWKSSLSDSAQQCIHAETALIMHGCMDDA